MVRTVRSRAGVPIRLTDERWAHIVEEHAELAGLREEVLETIAECDRVLAGSEGELLAVRMVREDKALVVVFRESTPADGFIITAFLTKRLDRLSGRRQVWP